MKSRIDKVVTELFTISDATTASSGTVGDVFADSHRERQPADHLGLRLRHRWLDLLHHGPGNQPSANDLFEVESGDILYINVTGVQDFSHQQGETVPVLVGSLITLK